MAWRMPGSVLGAYGRSAEESAMAAGQRRRGRASDGRLSGGARRAAPGDTMGAPTANTGKDLLARTGPRGAIESKTE